MAARVLVVDDDADWREYLRLSLTELGYEVDEASSGAEALAALQRSSYAVLLLDHYMPGMSGEEVVRKLPAPGPAVVLVTNARADDVSSALSRGPLYYLPKDASQGQLKLLLSSLVLPERPYSSGLGSCDAQSLHMKNFTIIPFLPLPW